jgi:hypothetical protein
MANVWWFVWMAVMLLLLLPLLGYGRGYRRWGLANPRSLQRRGAQRAVALGNQSAFDHQAWGFNGHIVWIAIAVGVVLAVSVCLSWW